MVRTLVILTVALTAFSAGGRTAHADAGHRQPWSGDRVFAVEVGNGFNAPTGLMGISIEYSPFRHLSFIGGVGYGDSSAQYSAMARLWMPGGRTSVGAIVHHVGLGWSTGRYTHTLPPPCQANYPGDDACPSPGDKVWDAAHRVNVEYSVELPLVASVLALRLYGGVSAVTNESDYRCNYTNATGSCGGNYASEGKVFPYVGVGLVTVLDWLGNLGPRSPDDIDPPGADPPPNW